MKQSAERLHLSIYLFSLFLPFTYTELLSISHRVCVCKSLEILFAEKDEPIISKVMINEDDFLQ